MSIIITAFQAQKEGVVLETNEPAKLKSGNLKSKKTWVSWDKIGELLFEDYTKKESVSDREKLRGNNPTH